MSNDLIRREFLDNVADVIEAACSHAKAAMTQLVRHFLTN